ncbi:MAG: cupin domain-containing protein [Bacteroidales bacterium]|nr:cupin domain-containing protein [Bacteroidales bacterium]MBR4980115.1 cupin domain-containing protein [Bacteroidales bacterium]MBR5400129.1 cupin domain-containing protein [Bacteroidales bacterium]MBR5906994.1 cupin domain-containing protein [Bacteroidales bacterium]
MDKIETKIGDRIKSVRKAKQISVGDVKDKTGIDDAFLKRLENDNFTPTIGDIDKISKVLGIRPGTFLDGEEDLKPVISSVNTGRRIPTLRKLREESPFMHFYSLCYDKKNRQMDAYMIEMEPYNGPKSHSSHEGEEFIFVMEGKVEVQYGKKTYILKPGETIYYDSIVPHYVGSAYKTKPAKVLTVIYFPA